MNAQKQQKIHLKTLKSIKTDAFYAVNEFIVSNYTPTLLLRLVMAIVLLSHSLPGMFDGGVNAFGNLFLNQIGFSPIGVPLAWAIKISHVGCAILFLLNKYIKPAAILTIIILLMGIVLVHWKEGWFVVGGGRNGIEYNVVLICVLVHLMFPNGLKRSE